MTVIAELVTLCIRKLPRSFLTVSLYLFTALGLLCMGLEMLIRHYLEARIFLTWSAVVPVRYYHALPQEAAERGAQEAAFLNSHAAGRTGIPKSKAIKRIAY